jgi:hypothetical protein
MPPRRFQLLFAFFAFVLITITLFGPPTSTNIPTYEDVKEAVKNPKEHLENLPVGNPFGPSAHKPPVQENSNSSSAYGAIHWVYDFKWKNPFSTTVTLDENTAVLPPLKERPLIYTFHEATKGQDKAVAEAENRLVLAWRRAWWAQGFRPMVLSRQEAVKHPQYDLVQRLKLDKIEPKVEAEFMRWLAWGTMRGGIMTNWLALPMSHYDNSMLKMLRRNEFPKLSRVDGLQNGVFFGDAVAVEEAIKKAIGNQMFKNTTANEGKIKDLKKDAGAIVNLLSKKKEDALAVESKSGGIAYYSWDTINSNYKTLSEKVTTNVTASGLDLLATLINSHLHLTFQSNFPDGVAVVKPLPEHTTALMYEAIDIARNLTQCPSSPFPKSCPPNKPRCQPCDPSKSMKLQLLPSFKNSTSLYSIGTVPHPYTLSTLHYTRDTLDANFIRQKGRDIWLEAAMKESVGEDHSNEKNVVSFKETVASQQRAPNSLWLTAERVSQTDLDWIFGFNLPQQSTSVSGNSAPPSSQSQSDLTIFARPDTPKPLEGVEVPEEKWIKNEEERLQKSREVLKSGDKLWKGVIEMVEQWNLADTEAWRFARAFSARRRQERKKWEAEEKDYAGSEKKSGVQTGGGGRWIDKF